MVGRGCECHTPTHEASTRRDEIREALRQRVVSGMHLGILKPGDRLPSTRELAPEIGADYRVIVAAYRELELDGLVAVRPRSGIRVAAQAHRVGDAPSRLARGVIDVLVDELMSGVPAPEFPERIRQCLETLRLRAACVECNDDQMARLCGELETDYGLETEGVDAAELRAGEPPPAALRRADVLVTTTFHAGPVRRVARALGKPHVVATLAPEYQAEIGRLLALGPVYFVGTDPRFAGKLRTIFRGQPGAEHVCPVILDRDRLDRIPDEAPVLVMPPAAPRIRSTAVGRRAVPPPRGFSAETARELLTFIVHANVAALEGARSGRGGSGRSPTGHRPR